MLKKQFRLPARTTLSNPRFIKTSLFTVKIAANDMPNSRFGFVISKRIAKNAVDRNRSKRVLRAYIEQHLEGMKKGYDYLFIMQKNLADEKTDVVWGEAEKALKISNV